MATRRATRRYDDLAAFLQDWEDLIRRGAIYLPAGTLRSEPAPELKLDLVLPIVGRVGPIPAQVVHRAPDGGVGLTLPEIPPQLNQAVERLTGFIEQVRAYLVASGELVPREDLESARAPAPEGTVAAAPTPGSPVPKRARQRGFALPDLSDVAPAVTGTMRDRSFRDLLMHLAVEEQTGLVVIRDPDGGQTRYGFWQKGGPVGWRSDPVIEDEVLGVLLYKADQLTKDQLERSLRIMEARGCRQGEALIEMGVLNFSQLVMVLGKQTEFILQKVLRERRGTWSFYPLDALPELFLPPPVRVASLLYRALYDHARAMRPNDLAALHQAHIDRYITLDPTMLPLLKDLRLSKNAQRFIEVLRSNSWRMREALSVSPLSRGNTAAMLWALDELGFLEYAEREDRSRYLQRIGTQIARKKAQINRGTHFEVLEVHWICLPNEVEQAWRRLRNEYDPNALQDLPAEMVRDLERIQAGIDRAYETLKNDARRREYRKGLIEPSMIVQSAELLAKKGEMAIMRADRHEACACFAKALELVPGKAEFREGLRRATALMA